MKQTHGPIGKPIDLIWLAGVFQRIDSLGPMARSPTADAAEFFLIILDELWSQSRYLSENPRAGNYAPKIVAAHPDNKRFKPADFARAMDILFQDKTIMVEEYRTVDRNRAKRISRCQKEPE